MTENNPEVTAENTPEQSPPVSSPAEDGMKPTHNEPSAPGAPPADIPVDPRVTARQTIIDNHRQATNTLFPGGAIDKAPPIIFARNPSKKYVPQEKAVKALTKTGSYDPNASDFESEPLIVVDVQMPAPSPISDGRVHMLSNTEVSPTVKKAAVAVVGAIAFVSGVAYLTGDSSPLDEGTPARELVEDIEGTYEDLFRNEQSEFVVVRDIYESQRFAGYFLGDRVRTPQLAGVLLQNDEYGFQQPGNQVYFGLEMISPFTEDEIYRLRSSVNDPALAADIDALALMNDVDFAIQQMNSVQNENGQTFGPYCSDIILEMINDLKNTDVDSPLRTFTPASVVLFQRDINGDWQPIQDPTPEDGALCL